MPRRLLPVIGSSVSGVLGVSWEMDSFTLVAAQTEYMLSFTDASDNPNDAIVQWGVTILPPSDYTMQSDRIVLTDEPTSEQAATGEPLVVRYKRLT